MWQLSYTSMFPITNVIEPHANEFQPRYVHRSRSPRPLKSSFINIKEYPQSEFFSCFGRFYKNKNKKVIKGEDYVQKF